MTLTLILLAVAVAAGVFLFATPQGREWAGKARARVAGTRTVYRLAVASDDSEVSAAVQAARYFFGS